MNILVCIKRVPVPGAKFVLTEDEQAINTKNLAFAISPHEECAVEEAIRLTKEHGGEATALTLGSQDAEAQLRGTISMGIQNAVLIEDDDKDWGAMATAKAIVSTIKAQEDEGIHYDMLFFGNESADSGGYQVGIRVAHALDLPCVTGVKAFEVDGDTVIAKREANGILEVFEVQLPAVFTIKEGINVPRYPTMPGRLKAKKEKIPHFTPEWSADGLQKVRLVTPDDEGKQVQILGNGADAVPKLVELLKELKVVES